jgi:hypothetical protein
VTNPPSPERPAFADLAADAADVQRVLDLVADRGRVLDLSARTVELPALGQGVVPGGDIPADAFALVAGLDSYGD